MSEQLPEKPELLDWIENSIGLPFKIPRLPFTQVAKNLDKAAAALVMAGADNLAARIRSSTARIEARSTAETALIDYGTAQIVVGDTEFAERARDYAIGDLLRAQKNRERVLEEASKQLEGETITSEAKSEIDEDWLNSFARYAEQKSKAEVQHLWGRILAAEIRHPGATSLRTLQFLSTVTSSEAQKIARAFTYVVNGAFIPKSLEGGQHVPYGDLVELQELNVISGLYGVGGHTLKLEGNPFPGGKMFTLHYQGRLAVFQSKQQDFGAQIGVLLLTEIGRQLFTLSDAISPDIEYFKTLCLQIRPASTALISLSGPSTGVSQAIFVAPDT